MIEMTETMIDVLSFQSSRLRDDEFISVPAGELRALIALANDLKRIEREEAEKIRDAINRNASA